MTNAITVNEACMLLRDVAPMSYHQVLRLVLRGEIEGGQRDGRRWWIDRASVERYRHLRQQATALPPAA